MNGYAKIVMVAAGFIASIAGGWIAGLNTHGERITRVETKVEYIQEAVNKIDNNVDRLIESLR